MDDDFRHPITAGLPDLGPGFTEVASRAGGPALDFIRGNLFDRLRMRPSPPDVPGPDNDLSDRLDHVVQRAIRDPRAEVYVFGQRWGPEPNKADKVFGFEPGNGVHDVHMNQGNVGRWVDDDGVWQDGGLLLRFPTERRWMAIFLAFQSQARHTDDRTGHAIRLGPDAGPAHAPAAAEPDHVVRVVAALVNPTGGAPEAETVTLLNASPQAVDLTGWAIADNLKRRHRLDGALPAGATRTIALPKAVQLGNAGGIVTLLNPDGLKVDGVAYTERQARREGWTIVF